MVYKVFFLCTVISDVGLRQFFSDELDLLIFHETKSNFHFLAKIVEELANLCYSLILIRNLILRKVKCTFDTFV
jgi:hypothetical protein